jgi:radical SAM superfamily enzyme YgiQ (UPF0313 family)
MAVMRVVLLSTFELGHQPFGLASPAAWLRAAGADVVAQDLSRDRLDEDAVRSAAVVAFYLPMHTATRLALPVIDRVRSLSPSARIAAYGLYALPNAGLLRARGVEGLFGGEFEAGLVAFALHPSEGVLKGTRVDIETNSRILGGPVARLAFITPDRAGLPPLSRYAELQHGARRLMSGYTEASRGCKHLCRHCPVVPVYGGQFRIVPVDVVLGDIRSQVAAGAEHVTFGDPDFFNGPAHAVRVVEALHAEFPGLTYDVTIKVEHLLRHARHLPLLKRTGCLFVTSAVESVDDTVLERLDKGHTSADVERAVIVCRSHGLALAPTFVPFTPWTTIAGYCDLLTAVARLDLVDQVAPVQLSIRLLIPTGSRLLELADCRHWPGGSIRRRWRIGGGTRIGAWTNCSARSPPWSAAN